MKILCALFFFTSLVFGSPGVDGVLAPGGVWWKPKSRITIDRPITLARDTTFTADEIVLRSPVTTQGHMLMLVARNLKFEAGARVRAFEAPANPIIIEGPAYPTAAPSGANLSDSGKDGAAGKPGFEGNPGMGALGPLPGEIVVFAAQAEGELIIEAVGQAGGDGGKGGPGQDGGDGAQGTPAKCALLGKNTPAGTGGTGGKPGIGGRGGKGGQGGAPVPVRFLLAAEPQLGQKLPVVDCRPGSGGSGGIVGDVGSPGVGGAGGRPDSINIIFTLSSEPGGASGASGADVTLDAATRAALTGVTGGPGPTVENDRWMKAIGRAEPVLSRSFEKFESERYRLALSWFEFHWWRLYERIARTSVDLLSHDVSKDAGPQDDDPLADLLPSHFDKEAVQTVSRKWSRTFTAPLIVDLQKARGRHEGVAKALEDILQTAKVFTETVQKAEKRGTFTPQDVAKLRDSLTAITQARENKVQEALDLCVQYVSSVLQSEEFLPHREVLGPYFEVPVCLRAGNFATEAGVQEPIELAHDFSAGINPEVEGATLENNVEPQLSDEHASVRGWFFELSTGLLGHVYRWVETVFLVPHAVADDRGFSVKLVPLETARLSQKQMIEFRPSRKQSTAVGSLGLHKGYAMPPPGAIDIDTLGKHLLELRRILAIGAER